MEAKEKNIIKLKIGLCIQKLIAQQNEVKSVEVHKTISSLRKLAASSAVEFAIIQKIASGKRNPALSTLVAICEGFGISTAELFALYDNITDKELQHKIEEIKKKKTKKKKKS